MRVSPWPAQLQDVSHMPVHAKRLIIIIIIITVIIIIIIVITIIIIITTTKTVYLASRHQVRAMQVSSLQTGLFRASRVSAERLIQTTFLWSVKPG